MNRFCIVKFIGTVTSYDHLIVKKGEITVVTAYGLHHAHIQRSHEQTCITDQHKHFKTNIR